MVGCGKDDVCEYDGGRLSIFGMVEFVMIGYWIVVAVQKWRRYWVMDGSERVKTEVVTSVQWLGLGSP